MSQQFFFKKNRDFEKYVSLKNKQTLFQKLSNKFEIFGIFKFGKNKYSGIKKFLTSDQKFFSDETHLVDFGTSNKVQENVRHTTLRHGQSPNRRAPLTTTV